MSKVEFITPAPPLKAKTGSGGLDSSILQQAEDIATFSEESIDTAIHDGLHKLKTLLNSKQLIEDPQEKTKNDFLHHLLPIKVDSTLYPNIPLRILTTQLLDFTDSIDTMNVDAYHIIRSHVNAMAIIFERKISDENHKFANALLSELEDSRVRFNKKYPFKNNGVSLHTSNQAQEA